MSTGYADAGDYNEDGISREQRLLGMVRSGDWLRAQEFPELQWAVPGILPEGFGLIIGAPKVGKSWLVLSMALAVASGGVALGHIRVDHPPRPVLYLALEDGPRRIQSRANTLLDGQGQIPDRLHIVTDMLTAGEVEDLIRFWLARHEGERPLVILDTLGKVMPPARPGETTYSRDYRVGGTFLQIAKQHPGSTIWAVHHTRKVQANDWMDATSGTNGLNGSADFTVMIGRERGKQDGTLYVTGREVLEAEYAVELNQSMQWTLSASTLPEAAALAAEREAADGLGDTSRRILGYVTDFPGSGPTRIADGLGMKPSEVGTYLQRLVQAGRIEKRGRGAYFPREHPVERVESVEKEGSPYEPSLDVVLVGTDSTASTDSTPPPSGCRLHNPPASPGRCHTCDSIAGTEAPS